MQSSHRAVKFEKKQQNRVSEEVRGRNKKLNKPQRGKNRWGSDE